MRARSSLSAGQREELVALSSRVIVIGLQLIMLVLVFTQSVLCFVGSCSMASYVLWKSLQSSSTLSKSKRKLSNAI